MIAAAGIPEGFHEVTPGRVAPGDTKADPLPPSQISKIHRAVDSMMWKPCQPCWTGGKMVPYPHDSARTETRQETRHLAA